MIIRIMCAVEIVSGLFLGSFSSVKETYTDIIINCTKDLPFPNRVFPYIDIRLPIDDNGTVVEMETFISIAPKIIERMDEYITNNKTILVHCLAGQQRSCALVALYLIKKHNMTIDSSIKYIKSCKRDAFFYDVNFMYALKKCTNI